MSTKIGTIKNTGKKDVDLDLTVFYGGDKKGTMIQLTQGFRTQSDNDEPGFIQITKKDACCLISELAKWIKKEVAK
ncbi:MAG: hypothetical protein KKD18_03055 [Nanoarchaeota archaeon]|nr:hypothetical protein [Nanoarchaeota archaeon]